MIIEFKTARNANGSRKYLAIDTNAEIYTTFNPYMITNGIEIKAAYYKELLAKLERLNYQKKRKDLLKCYFMKLIKATLENTASKRQ